MSRMMMTGPWREAISTAKKLHRGAFNEAVSHSIAQEAMLMEAYVAKGFKQQGLHRRWSKLSTVTLAIRKKLHGFGGSKALQVTNSLRRSVTAKKIGKFTWFVGVHRSARTSKGKKMVNIAAVHEGPFPTLIPCDTTSEKGRKVRKFFLALFLQGVVSKPLSSKRKVLVIMPRPFLKPAYDKTREGNQRRMIKRVKDRLKKHGVEFG